MEMDEEWWKWKDDVWIVRESHGTKGGLWSTFLQWMKCMNGMDG